MDFEDQVIISPGKFSSEIPWKYATLAAVILLLSACLTNYSAQEERQPITVIEQSDSTSTDSQTTAYFEPDPSVKDPLFFLEDQLCQHLRKIHQDTKGNLWFRTNVYGWMRYDEGLETNGILSIYEDREGWFW